MLAPPPHYPLGALMPGAESLLPGTVHAGEFGEPVHRVAWRPYQGDVGSRLADQLVAASDSVAVALRRFSAARARPDVVVATVPSVPSLGAGVAVSRALGVPLVTELRDAWPDLLGAAHEWDAAGRGLARRPGPLRGLGLSGAAWAVTALERQSALVVTTTQGLADLLSSRGIRRTALVRNAFHGLPAAPTEHNARGAGSGSRPLRVLYAGTVGRAQGLSTAVEAVARAARCGVPVHLRIVGAGAESGLVARLAERTGATVSVQGPVSRAALGAHYAWADTALACLRPWPGLHVTVPSKVYELMALGLHVTASLDGEAAEVVTQAHAGHVAPAGDAAALAGLWGRLWRSPALLQVGDDGRAWVHQHADPDRLAEDYLRALTTVVRAA